MEKSGPAEHAARQPDVFVVQRDYYTNTSTPQSTHEDLTSDLDDFEAVSYSDFTLFPTSIGTITNLTTPPTYAHPVSKQWCDDQR